MASNITSRTEATSTLLGQVQRVVLVSDAVEIWQAAVLYVWLKLLQAVDNMTNRWHVHLAVSSSRCSSLDAKGGALAGLPDACQDLQGF